MVKVMFLSSSILEGMCLFNLIHEYVACKLFSFTFEGKASLWFYFLPLNSISSWLKFKNVFRDSFEYYDIIEIHQNMSQMQFHDG